MATFGNVPPSLKRIQPYLKIADDHEKKDIVICYWCRLYAVQTGLKIDSKSKDCSAFLISIMDWLEKTKKENHENEAISNDVVAQAHIENYALKLFLWADGEDRAAVFNKNVVKSFYTAGLIYDVVSVFGEPSDEVAHHKKYAKWKATYIHNSLKNGITPVPGPMAMENEEGFSGEDFAAGSSFNNPLDRPENPMEPQNTDSFSSFPAGNSDSSGQVPYSGGVGGNSDGQAPYPIGGIFGSQGLQSINLVPPVPGAHAPPSTPNGSSQPSPSSTPVTYTIPENTSAGGVTLRPEDFHKAQKYCKWAGSALQYEDVPTAIGNLQKALLLLTTGKDE